MAFLKKGPIDYLHNLLYESFLTILMYYVDLNCFIILSDPDRDWLAVHYHRRRVSLYDFEKKYNFSFDFGKLTDSVFEASVPKGNPLLMETLGFYDLFTPIRQEGRRLGTVLSGAFADREPTYDHLRNNWKRMTGRNASADDPEFREFVRVMLDTPVLEGPVLSAFNEAMGLFAAMMAGNPPLQAPRRIRQLMEEVFSKHFPHSYWMDWALGLPTVQDTPLWGLQVQDMPWVRSEIGIQRIPTTVMAVVPAGPGDTKRDAVEEMLRIYRFQRRAFRFARELPQTVAGRLENYGVVFVTSADAALPRLAQRRRILETAGKIQKFSSEELGGPAFVGIGETVRPGESMRESFRQAVWALHLQKNQGKRMVFFSQGHTGKSEGAVILARLLLDLKRRFECASFSNFAEAVDGYLKQVLSLSFQNPAEIRWHLHYAIVQAGEAVNHWADRGGKKVSRMVESMIFSLEKSTTTQEMILAFKNAMEKLVAISRKPGRTREFSSMEKVRDHLERHYRESMKITRLAKMTGVSPATFSRWFKKANGVGLEAHLQDLRLNESRRLLKTGSLPISKIARSCGFKSRPYFMRLFRKKTGMTPTAFREKLKSF
jgi:AraC-like DNA-binding protein